MAWASVHGHLAYVEMSSGRNIREHRVTATTNTNVYTRNRPECWQSDAYNPSTTIVALVCSVGQMIDVIPAATATR
jgi:hypothetical protein